MQRLFGALGAISALAAVTAGAFGAHALRSRLSTEMLDVFETGARYQMYHALALIAVSLAAARASGTALRLAGWSFIAGTLLFSGSLYLLCLTGQRWLGAVTPFGGTFFLLGWLAFAWGLWKRGS